MSSPNLHDSFFRDWIREPGVLADYLQHYLPPHIVALVDTSSASIVPGSFVDAELQQQLTDLLCTVKLHTGNEVFIYCLIEHKSYPDRWVAFQVLRYMVQIWQDEIKNKASKLTPIVPIVLYHGEDMWRVSTQFATLFGELGAQIGFVPRFEYFLTDLTTLDETQIQGTIVTRVGLLGLKYSRNPQATQKLLRVMALLSEITDRKFAASQTIRLLKYVVRASDLWQQNDVQAAIAAAEPNINLQEITMSDFAKELIESGVQIGRNEGMQIGRSEGMQATIARLIERKLGPLQTRERERIAKMSVSEQMTLTDLLIDGVLPTYSDLVKKLAT